MKSTNQGKSTKRFSDPASIAKAIEAQRQERSVSNEYVEPRTLEERKLAEIWASLLRVDRIGAFDNFFQLGGHSLLATQMLARVRKSFGVELPLRTAFDAPVLAALALKLASSEKGAYKRSEITRHTLPDRIPLSFAQQRLWFLQQLDPGSPVYNVAELLQLDGDLDLSILSRSINEIVHRHESLRTQFRTEDDQPVQHVLPELTIDVRPVDLRDIDAHERVATAEALALRARLAPFDLGKGPLLRVSLFRLENEAHWMLLEMHHIISDRWSMGVFHNELSQCYAAIAVGSGASLPSLSIQYADYAIWQRRELEADVLSKQLQYWGNQLRDVPKLLELPLDHPRPSVQSHRGSSESELYPKELIERLQAIADEAGGTLFMVLLAGIQILLGRLAGQEDVVIGSPIANRSSSELEGLIGFFVNTIVLRGNFSGNPTFRDFLSQVRQTCLDAYAHESVPFERLVEELQPDRSLSHNPIFQVMFAFQTAPLSEVNLPKIEIKRLALPVPISTFDLTWIAVGLPDGMMIRVEYNTDIFQVSTIRRMLARFRVLLEGICQDPESKVSHLPILAEEERGALQNWNQTGSEFNEQACLHELFEEQVQRTPGATAVTCGSQRLSYAELNERSNQLAAFLRCRGSAPGKRVALMLERSVEMMVALFGILKSGAAYVPLDPVYPRDRLKMMLEDCQAHQLITTEGLGKAQSFGDLDLILLDRDADAIASCAVENIESGVGPQNVMYVIFTSGSTGRPKGVEVRHRGVVNLMTWMHREFALGPRDCIAVLSSIAFDMSVPELFPALTSGGSVVIGEPGLAANGEALAKFLRDHGCTYLMMTPTTWTLLLEAGFSGSGAKRVSVAEPLSKELLNRLISSTDEPTPLWNGYGPTEDSVWTTSHRFELPNENVVIGRPIANKQVYILDANGEQCAIGSVGEICIGGIGVAKGYLGKPEMTADKFVPDIYSSDDEAKLYKSGDRGRFLESGDIELVGRADDQVKIRGYRIELGEIEATLASIGQVIESTVVVHEFSGGDKRLVAYVVLKEGQSSAIAEVQHLVKARLPEYMVPTLWTQMEKLPRSPNRKIDRSALPKPEPSPNSVLSFESLSPTEEIIEGILSEVLHRGDIGRTDNFFDMGGHSLLATQVMSRIRDAFSIEMPLRTLFENPTIAGLARNVEWSIETDVPWETLPMRRVDRNVSIPLSSAQQRLWFLHQLEPTSHAYNASLILKLHGSINVNALEDALNGIIARHEVLRTVFAVRGDGPVQVIKPHLRIGIELIDSTDQVSADWDNTIQQAVAQRSNAPFDLERGPLIRAALLKLSEDTSALLLDTHHIVNDGWSTPRFAEELDALYRESLSGVPALLPDLPVQYADYSAWQHEYLRGEVLNRHLSYWIKHLKDAPESLNLPTTRVRPAVQTSRGAIEKTVFTDDLKKKLVLLSRKERVTLFMTMLAAFEILLHRYTNQEDIVVGTSVANRNHVDVERLIGFFVNALAIRIKLTSEMSYREVLSSVRESSLSAYAHQDLPFEKVVDALQPTRDMSRNPLFQVWFVLHNTEKAVMHLDDIEVTPMQVHNGTSKADLAFFIAERSDGISCTVEYSTDLFDAAAIKQMIGNFGTLLEAVVDHPDALIGTLPLLSERELHEIVVERNRTETGPPIECVPRLFELQVQRTPSNVACELFVPPKANGAMAPEYLDYVTLNTCANKLANHIKSLGVGPEVLVGVCLEKTFDLPISILAVLKSSGAYLPLDPSYPSERLKFMIEDAGVNLVLTTRALIGKLGESVGCRIICLDEQAGEIDEHDGTDLAPVRDLDQLAYVIYTSGSTGQPKGAMLTHKGLSNYLCWAVDAYKVEDGAGAPVSSAIGFDATITSFFTPLLSGGRIVLLPDDNIVEALGSVLKRRGFSLIKITPAHLDLLSQLLLPEECARAANAFIIGGEALRSDRLKFWLKNAPDTRFVNEYGPTETVVGCCVYEVNGKTPPEKLGTSSVPIGRPIANTQLYVLDRNMQPVPDGVVGELYIGGAGVGRGYLNRPELTASRFLPDPFSARPDARLYRTGDLVRYIDDGNLEFLGRADAQVKIRGYRSEPGEIEKSIEALAGVQQSVVIARPDASGEQQLVAYVVPDYDSRVLTSDVSSAEDLSQIQVSEWAATFDDIYRGSSGTNDPTFNITGWDSSYTQKPIAVEEMREWVDTTVKRILQLGAKSIWEIGSGTGLLLFQVAPTTQRYVGTDLSSSAVEFVKNAVSHSERMLPQVTVRRQSAHEPVAEHDFDAVILNSVIQYFPDYEYLLSVLRTALNSLKMGGKIFIGDVRDFQLWQAFHTSVQLFHSPDDLEVEQLKRLIRNSIDHDAELLISPQFFHSLHTVFPEIDRVEIQLKRGYPHNELTCYRYDVVLHKGETRQTKETECTWIDWGKEALTIDSLRRIVRETMPEVLAITGIPNARVLPDVVSADLLSGSMRFERVYALRNALADRIRNFACVEPEDLWRLGEEHGYAIEMRSSGGASPGKIDLLLRREMPTLERKFTSVRFQGDRQSDVSLSDFASKPLKQRIASSLPEQLRTALVSKLPDFMIPSAFVLLDEIPLTVNGKVDREALPAPSYGSHTNNDALSPRNPIEEMAALIWAEVLGVDWVGVQDNFFSLGGHSLSAARVVSRVRQTFGVELPLRALFEFPVLEEFSTQIRLQQSNTEQSHAPAILPIDREKSIPLSYSQQRIWFMYQLDPDTPLYNVLRAFRLRGNLDVASLRSALSEMVGRHEILRTSYGVHNEAPAQVIDSNFSLALTVTDLSSLEIQERERQARLLSQSEADTPFNLSSGPVLRITLLKLSEEDHVLLLNIHHIATDGWSNAILARELRELYGSFLEGRQPARVEGALQYADFAVWQQSWLTGEILERKLDFWSQRLQGAPRFLQLASDRPRPPVQKFSGGYYTQILDSDLTSRIRSLSRTESVTPFMTMLTAFKLLLMRYSGQTDIVVGTDVANRPTRDCEAMVGFFINLLVLRTDISGDLRFIDLIKKVRETTLAAFAHSDVPFEKLVERIQPERNLTHNPLVQVLFVMQNTPPTALTLPGLEVSPFLLEYPSKFDVAVFATEFDGKIACTWLYNSELFDASRIVRTANILRALLDLFTHNPELKYSEIVTELSGEEERCRIEEHKEFESANLARLKGIQRRSIGTA